MTISGSRKAAWPPNVFCEHAEIPDTNASLLPTHQILAAADYLYNREASKIVKQTEQQYAVTQFQRPSHLYCPGF